MKHVSHEQLWNYARAELPADEVASVAEHVDSCVACFSTLEDVRAAQRTLSLLPEPPPMPAALAHRVGSNLADALDSRQAQRWLSWFPSMPRWSWAALAVGSLAAAAWLAVHSPPVAAPTPPVVAEVVEPVVVPPVPALPKLTATVASAKHARSGTAALGKSQVVHEGSSLSTEKGGSLWLRLPDGSRAGLTGATEVQLATLAAKTLTLDLAKGNLALVVPHRQDRVLTVRAGELEVKDLGTQFLVSREVARTVVAVEEGSVEVKVPGETRTVKAGTAVAWQQGQLQELEWRPPPTAAASSTAAKANAAPAPEPVAAANAPSAPNDEPNATGADVEPTVLPNDGLDETPPPPEDPAAEWNAPPPSALVAQPEPPPVEPSPSAPPPPDQVITSTPRTALSPPARGSSGFSLGSIERRLRELQSQIRSPFTQGGSLRAQRAKDIARHADAGDCMGALNLADDWLRYAHDPPEEAPLRREVLFQKMRCLTRLGRLPEADQVRRQLEAMPR